MGVFLPSPRTSHRRDALLQRAFEIVPGLLLWSTFLGLFIFLLLSTGRRRDLHHRL
ncbi:MAG: hypothetical protein MPW15_00185 [Candidatus Manganitrophus sp.]|nr:hypothetical protein [Candidatus Manganitrophus sp.]